MRNFGLTDLVLVEPVADPRNMDAVMMATRGLDILKAARIVPTLAEAVGDCGLVLATSGEVGGLARKGLWGTPEEKVPLLLDGLDRGRCALVFGPEPSGLTVDEITACHGMIFVPTDETYPSLNLAQSVAIVLYELRKLWLKRTRPDCEREPPAGYDEQERMFAQLREALVAVRFLWDFRSDGVFHVLRQVITRGMPTTKELRAFHGLAQQLLYVANRWGVTHPRDGRPPRDDQQGGRIT
jgi:TrmH family RNA methyltransferase